MLPNRIVCHGSSWRQFETKVSTPPIDAMCSLVSACAVVVDHFTLARNVHDTLLKSDGSDEIR
jgi:hypothetical protein